MHEALDDHESQSIALGHHPILIELPRGGVQDRHTFPGSGQDGSLLAAAGRQAQDVTADDVAEPIPRHRSVGRQDERPVTQASAFDLLRRHGPGPDVLFLNPEIPAELVEPENVFHRHI